MKCRVDGAVIWKRMSLLSTAVPVKCVGNVIINWKASLF